MLMKKIETGKTPPVHYDEHIIRPHSLTHLETPAHTNKDGKTLESFYNKNINHFFGKILVIKLSGNKYQSLGKGIFHWVVSVNELKERFSTLEISDLPSKILISTDFYPMNAQGYHDPNYVLTLSQEAANFLISNENFDLYGTSWKSSDYCPGSIDRPIHNTLFKKALILENLNLK